MASPNDPPVSRTVRGVPMERAGLNEPPLTVIVASMQADSVTAGMTIRDIGLILLGCSALRPLRTTKYVPMNSTRKTAGHKA